MKTTEQIQLGDTFFMIQNQKIVSKVVTTKIIQVVETDTIDKEIQTQRNISFQYDDNSFLQGETFFETKQELIDSL